MAVQAIAHKPELTKEQAKEIFRAGFDGKYKVEDFRGLLRDFMVVKSAFVGVAIKLEQTGSETKFVYGGLAPRVWARLLMGSLIGIFLWGPLTSEVRAFVESAPEFH